MQIWSTDRFLQFWISDRKKYYQAHAPSLSVFMWPLFRLATPWCQSGDILCSLVSFLGARWLRPPIRTKIPL